MKNVSTGDMYFVDYEVGNPEDRLFGKKAFRVERRDLSTVIETQDSNDTIQYIVSSGVGRNADAGTLGKMITLLEDNNPRPDQQYEIAFQETTSLYFLINVSDNIWYADTKDQSKKSINSTKNSSDNFCLDNKVSHLSLFLYSLINASVNF